jgi:ribosomal-protein-alanine N-acetyltransferase
LGNQPYLVLEHNYRIVAALACPPDEDGGTWLRLFAVSPGLSIHRAWRALWPPALGWLQDKFAVQQVNALVVQDQMLNLLTKSGFQEGYRVVVLVWDISQARWPDQKETIQIRGMLRDDFLRIYEIDQVSFEPIWRNSLSHIEIAYQEASSASVAMINNRLVGFQISTINPQGGHLARLAVDPEYQKLGVGTALVEDLLDRFQRQGIVRVTVNTQARNYASLELYNKFGFEQLDEFYPVFQYNLNRSPQT